MQKERKKALTWKVPFFFAVLKTSTDMLYLYFRLSTKKIVSVILTRESTEKRHYETKLSSLWITFLVPFLEFDLPSFGMAFCYCYR